MIQPKVDDSNADVKHSHTLDDIAKQVHAEVPAEVEPEEVETAEEGEV